VTELLREHLERLREEVLAGRLEGEALTAAVAESAIAGAVADTAAALVAPRPRSVINATGIVVHTNLGRALLGAPAADQVAAAARGYLDLEYDVDAGRRGDRLASLEPLMGRLRSVARSAFPTSWPPPARGSARWVRRIAPG
jgi:L-seryl-tRNA(Ser) seleniumtransferase